MKKLLLALGLAVLPSWAAAESPVEIHNRLAYQAGQDSRIALTLDACGGGFDRKLINFLISHKVPATIFATRKWLAANPRAVAIIKAHLDLFDVEDHGANHVPAVVGAGKRVYGIRGEPDVVHLRREVSDGARAIEEQIGVAPHWYRGATAEYDSVAIAEIGKMGYRIAGFSVNADAGATLDRAAIEKRLRRVRAGDVIIAHMNKPSSDTAAGLSAGIRYLLGKGYVFVRVDQTELRPLPPEPRPAKRHS